MQDLKKFLYEYAQQNQVPNYLQTTKYRRATRCLEDEWEGFRSGLTEEQNQTLDALLSRENDVETLESEASFLAGVAIGLDLGRL